MEGVDLRAGRRRTRRSRVGLDLGQVERIAAAALDRAHPPCGDPLPRVDLVGARDRAARASQPRHVRHPRAPRRRPAAAPTGRRRCATGTAAARLQRPRTCREARLLRSRRTRPRPRSSASPGRKRAVAVFLDEGEEFEAPATASAARARSRTRSRSPTAKSLPWVVLTRGRQIRVYAAQPGRRCRAQRAAPRPSSKRTSRSFPTTVPATSPLLFSADALKDGGTFEEILDGSARLRRRSRRAASRPRLRRGRARRSRSRSRDATRASSTRTALDAIYEQALTVLFRLLFVAYAEDKDLLPYRSNGAYREHALKTLARELAERRADGPLVFDANATDLWDDVAALWRAVDKGNVERGVPPYNGGLFSSDPEVNAAGAALAALDARRTPSSARRLRRCWSTRAEDGVVGPVDFRSLSVREFGTIYEGLLESSLSVAPSRPHPRHRRQLRPGRATATRSSSRQGEVYFHDRSGARKATGSLLHEAVRRRAPARPRARARPRRPPRAARGARSTPARRRRPPRRSSTSAASTSRWGRDTSSSPPSTASRHGSPAFLAQHPIPQVTRELDRLRAAALEALGPLGEGVEIEHASLLRRQVARRCVYGVDLQPDRGRARAARDLDPHVRARPAAQLPRPHARLRRQPDRDRDARRGYRGARPRAASRARHRSSATRSSAVLGRAETRAARLAHIYRCHRRPRSTTAREAQREARAGCTASARSLRPRSSPRRLGRGIAAARVSTRTSSRPTPICPTPASSRAELERAALPGRLPRGVPPRAARVRLHPRQPALGGGNDRGARLLGAALPWTRGLPQAEQRRSDRAAPRERARPRRPSTSARSQRDAAPSTSCFSPGRTRGWGQVIPTSTRRSAGASGTWPARTVAIRSRAAAVRALGGGECAVARGGARATASSTM